MFRRSAGWRWRHGRKASIAAVELELTAERPMSWRRHVAEPVSPADPRRPLFPTHNAVHKSKPTARAEGEERRTPRGRKIAWTEEDCGNALAPRNSARLIRASRVTHGQRRLRRIAGQTRPDPHAAAQALVDNLRQSAKLGGANPPARATGHPQPDEGPTPFRRRRYSNPEVLPNGWVAAASSGKRRKGGYCCRAAAEEAPPHWADRIGLTATPSSPWAIDSNEHPGHPKQGCADSAIPWEDFE